MEASTVMVKFGGIAKEFSVSNTLDLGFTTVRWYGVIIAFGFLLAVLFGGRIAWKWKISLDKMIDVLLYGTIFGIIGARLYYVAFRWDYYSQHPGDIIKIWEGGLAIYGGIIGGILAAYIVCRIEKLNFRNLLDMVAMSLLIGQGIGRWGNFANQEAFGTFTNANFGMMSDTVASYIADHPESYNLQNVADIPAYIAENNLFVHPTFFYESVWCLLGFALLYIIMRKKRIFSGQLFLCYGVWYGFERMIVEGMRTDSLYIGQSSVRVSQVLSGAIMAVSLVLLVVLYVKYKKNPKPVEGVDFFQEKTEKELLYEKKKQEKKALSKKAKRVVIRNGKIQNNEKPSEVTEEAPEDTEEEEEEDGDGDTD